MQNEKNKFPELDDFLTSLRIGEAQTHKNLTVYPVFSDKAGNNGYKLLDEAIKTELFQVMEVSDGGSVPDLKVINKLDEDVLILDGEELVGAKQNRIVNTTIIIVKRKEMVIPVSCVEQGRWSYKGRRFVSSKWSLSADIRKEKSRAVKANLQEHAAFSSDQSLIWSRISEKAASLNVACETGAMGSMYETYEGDLKEYGDAFPVQAWQIGFVAVIDGKIVGCDVLALKALFPKVLAKMLSGYLLDAVEQLRHARPARKRAKVASAADVHAFFDKVKSSKKEAYASAGEGTDIRFEHSRVNGFAVVRDGAVIHMAAFPEN